MSSTGPQQGDSLVEQLVQEVVGAETPNRFSQRDEGSPPLVRFIQALLPTVLEIKQLNKRCIVAFIRSIIYMQAGNATQALLDARAAIAYAPQGTCKRCDWAPAWAAAAHAYGASGKSVECARHLLQAIELDMGLHPQLLDALEELQHSLPVDVQSYVAQVLLVQPRSKHGVLDDGALPPARPAAARPPRLVELVQQATGGIDAWLQHQELMATPEFKRPREKYGYYKQWMQRRVLGALGLPGPASYVSDNQLDGSTSDPLITQGLTGAAAGLGSEQALPGPVLAKLLTMNADDLDLLVRHPLGIKAQVVELLSVWVAGGESGLEQHAIEPPSWEEVRALVGAQCEGLPLGYNATNTSQLVQAPELPDLLQRTSDVSNPAGIPRLQLMYEAAQAPSAAVAVQLLAGKHLQLGCSEDQALVDADVHKPRLRRADLLLAAAGAQGAAN